MHIEVGMNLPERRYEASNVSLFLYNAAVWNPHRIHYDETYTTQVEGHAGIVIDGPLQGDWLSQVVLNWIKDNGQLIEFEYSNRRASVLGEVLSAGGRITAINNRRVECELWIKNDAGEVTTPGSAVVELNDTP